MRLLHTLRTILLPLGLIVIGTFAVVTALGEAPQPPTPPTLDLDGVPYLGSDNEALADAVESDFQLNDLGSDTVYQQMVTAGWASKDMLDIVARTTGRIDIALSAANTNLLALLASQQQVVAAAALTPPVDERPQRLLAAAVVAVSWIGAWSVVPATRRRQQADTIVDEVAPSAEPPAPLDAPDMSL